jgi:chromate transporter
MIARVGVLRWRIVTPVSLSRLIRAFAWTGLTSLGGGRSAYFHDQVVVRRPWLTNQEFAQDFTLSQILPGPNFSNLGVVIGYRLAGGRGAAVAALALLLPGALALLALTILYFKLGLTPDARPALRGMSAAVVGLVAMACARLAWGVVRTPGAAVVALITFAAVGPLRVNTGLAILLALGIALLLRRRGARPPAAGAEGSRG